jgi:hypothetical protein
MMTENTRAASQAPFLPKENESEYQSQSSPSGGWVRSENSTIDSGLAGLAQLIHSSTYNPIPVTHQSPSTVSSNTTSIISGSNITTTDKSSSLSWITTSNTESSKSEKNYQNKYSY